MNIFIILLFFILLLSILILLFLLKNKIIKDQTQNNETLLKITEVFHKLDSLSDLTALKTGEKISNNTKELIEKFSELKEQVIQKLGNLALSQEKELTNFKDNLSKSQITSFDKLEQKIDTRLNKISDKVQENLDQGFKKTNETFNNVLVRLTKIDEAQKQIEGLSHEVTSLQDILTDKKSRGIFGEVQLHQILSSVFGDKNDKLYRLQHTLSNSKICDAIIFLPPPTNNLCVDSKFPLENYKRMFDKNLSIESQEEAKKEFKRNVKKHIEDIASKYIIQNETADQAIMFLPAEAIFSEIHAHHEDLITFAMEKKVWPASPTTFLATLTTMQAILIDMERNKHMAIIREEISKLGDEFSRYKDRWERLSKNIEQVNKNVKDLNITSEKISGRFQSIMSVEFEPEKSLQVQSSSGIISEGEKNDE